MNVCVHFAGRKVRGGPRSVGLCSCCLDCWFCCPDRCFLHPPPARWRAWRLKTHAGAAAGVVNCEYASIAVGKNRKYSAGSDDTASMIKGGGYVGARTRQPPTAAVNSCSHMLESW